MNLLVARLAAWTQGRYNYGNCRKSSKIFESVRKNSESTQNDLPTIFENFRKSSEVFGNAQKSLETLEKISNVSEVYKIFNNIPISDICGVKIGSKNSDL